MPKFNAYHAVFGMFGYRLSDADGYGDLEVEAAINECPYTISRFLVEFYQTAGRNKQFSQICNRFVSPNDWKILDNHLLFLQNDQTQTKWGILLGTVGYELPPVEMAASNGGIDWCLVAENLPAFLTFTLHWNAVHGGFDFCGTAKLRDNQAISFNGWSHAGIVAPYTAYSRLRQAVCIGDGQIVAGAKTEKDFRKIARDLDIVLE